jgi:hypothetical protein
MASANFAISLIVTIAVVFVLAWIIRKKAENKRGGYNLSFLTKAGGLEDSTPALIKYKPTSRFERVVEDVIDYYLTKNRIVLLVSTAPRTQTYAKLFSEDFRKGNLIIVNMSASSRTDSFYLTNQRGKKEELKGKVAEISVDWLEYLSEVIEGLPRESKVVFEPLSDIVLMNGFDKTFKFTKKTLDYCAGENIQMISFINDEAHVESVKASFEGLYTNIANISNDKLETLK